MTTNKNNNISIPTFFYRDIQQNVLEIQNAATQLGSVKEAMRQYLAPHADKLSAEHTVDQIIDQISETTRAFCDAEARITQEDIRQKLEEAVGACTEEEAFCYLSMLEATFTALDASADNRMKMMSADDIKAEIEKSAANPGDTSLAERIDQMVDTISQDGLKAFVFAGGNDQILRAVSQKDQNEGAQTVANVLNDSFEKTDHYAMVACACYGQIINGKIEGITAENADPRMVAMLVSAGLSKGSILKRLFRGEIDMEMAKELLGHVENAIKWVLATLYQIFLGSVVFTALVSFIALLEISSTFCTILLALATVLSIGIALYADDDAKDFSELLVSLGEFILSLPVKLGKFIYKSVKNHRQAQPAQQLPQAQQPAQA